MNETTQISLAPYLDIIHRHRLSALSALAVGLLLTFVLVLFFPDRYRSTAVLIIRSPEVSQNYVADRLSTRLQQRLHALSELALSQDQLTGIITQYNLYPRARARHEEMADIVDRMRGRINVDLSPGRSRNQQGESFSISFSYPNPALAQQVAAKLADTFINDDLQARIRQATATTQFVNDELSRIGANLSKKGQEIKDFEDKFRGSLPADLQTNLKTAADLQTQLAHDKELVAELEQKRMQIEGEQVQAREQELTVTTPSGSQSSGSPQAVLNDLQTQLARMRAQYSDSYPDVVALSAQVAALKKEVKDRERHPEKYESPVERELGREHDSIALRISTRQREAVALKAQIKQISQAIAATPAHQQALAGVQRDYQVLESTYHDLLQKKLAAQMSQNLEQRQQGERLEVLDPPALAQKPVQPDRLTVGIAGVALSGLLALGLPFMLFFTDTSFKDPDEFGLEHGLPIAATIPLVEALEPGTPSRTARLRAVAICSACVAAGAGLIWFAALRGLL